MSKIQAIVTKNGDKIAGGAPIFLVESDDELQQCAFKLEKALDCPAIELESGTLIIVNMKD